MLSLMYSCAVSAIVIENSHKDVGLIQISTIIDKILAGLLGSLALLFLLPVGYLVFIHCNNFALNSTTNERFSKSTKVKEEDQSSTFSYVAPKQGCFKNFISMCCNKGTPKRVSIEFRKVEENDSDYKEILNSLELQFGSKDAPIMIDIMNK